MNFNINGNFDLINATKNLEFDTALDIRLGEGGATSFFALMGKDVTALGLNIDSYDYPKLLLEKLIEICFDNFDSEKKKFFKHFESDKILISKLNVEQKALNNQLSKTKNNLNIRTEKCERLEIEMQKLFKYRIMKFILNDKKYKKLIKEPNVFFQDSKNKYTKMLKKYYV